MRLVKRLLGKPDRQGRISQSRRHASWDRFDWSPFAGSSRRVSEDRSAARGCGSVSTRCQSQESQKSLETVIESCVNEVGVDLNTASVPYCGTLPVSINWSRTIWWNIARKPADSGAGTRSRKYLALARLALHRQQGFSKSRWPMIRSTTPRSPGKLSGCPTTSFRTRLRPK